MHEDSTVENKRTYQYTSNQSAIENKLRKFRKLGENLKPDAVKPDQGKSQSYPSVA
ncbi:hypothetical protein BDF14DRAFT_1766121 [Spinellus fusiger]|nr:hypothetical protein BDF14DRAFT_1766098 [Spinellus fusiger]KAI7871357.1 hypothetical protein BDF14DRAFT_1766121 [Spinellus fusiger]